MQLYVLQISLYQCRDSLYLALGFITIYSQGPQSTPLSYFFMLCLTVKVALLSNVSIFCSTTSSQKSFFGENIHGPNEVLGEWLVICFLVSIYR